MRGELTVLGTVTLPGVDRSVSLVRRFVSDTLGPDHPCLDDVRLCLSELATNAIWHSDSGLPGGRIDVLLAAGDGGLRAEVTDDGAQGAAPLFRTAPTGGPETDADGSGGAEAEAAAETHAEPEPAGSVEATESAADAESGRGLPIVEALSVRWGIRTDGRRTTVWTEFTGSL